MSDNKSFLEILAEKADEYNYTIYSTADIHDPERFARVRLSCLPYQVKHFEASSYMPWSKGNKKFPNEPNSPMYIIKLVTSLPINCKALVQLMAMQVHIHASHLLIEPDSDESEVELVNKPEEIDAQKLVGEKRIGAFVKELQDQRNDRMKQTITREVYESYFTTQLGLEKLVKQPLRKGYYMVETYKDDNKTYLIAEGPFDSRPDGNIYRDKIPLRGLKTLSESVKDGTYEVKMLVSEDYDITDHMYEVKVKDTQSGRKFSTLVRASRPQQAMEIATRQVSEEHHLDPKHLITLTPQETTGVGSSW